MAALVASFPLPLLLDSLLASSWTWLALSLATIATLLRALSRSPLSRHRPQALLPSPPSIFCAETEQIPSFTSEVSRPLRNTQTHGSKGSPALEILLRKPDGLACPDLGFFSCMRYCHAPHLPLPKAASASKLFNGHPSIARGFSSEGALRSCLGTIDCKLGLGLRVGFLVDTQKGGCETPTHGCNKEGVNPYNLWTSDAILGCKPLQNTLFIVPYSSLEVPPYFEMQFGWCKLLETRLGAPWRNHTSGLARALRLVLEPTIHDEGVVKVWSTHQRNLFKALMIEESSVAALDVNIRDGLACIACRDGEISLWDITNQACLSRVCSNVKSISALCLNAERGVITGNGEFLGVWDYKSPSLIALMDGSKKPVNASPNLALQCKGDMLRIDQTNGVFVSCDLRKPQGRCLSIGTNSDSLPVASKIEEEESVVLWEKLACDEEELWDEYHVVHCDAPQKSSSFTSRCATLVRSLSTSGR